MPLEMFVFLPKDVTILFHAFEENFLFNMPVKIINAEKLQEQTDIAWVSFPFSNVVIALK